MSFMVLYGLNKFCVAGFELHTEYFNLNDMN